MKKIPLKYFSEVKWKKIKCFNEFETPYILLDLETIEKKFKIINNLFSFAQIYYSVKANPEKEVISLLKTLGSNFDIASIYELDEVLELGVLPKRINFTNTIKKRKDIRYCFEKGINDFTTDSLLDIENIAQFAPNSKVSFRILVDGAKTADWPLNKKFGCKSDMVLELIKRAIELDLVPNGISFHVGSQQTDIKSWVKAISIVKDIIELVKNEFNIDLKSINIGGGFPVSYKNKVDDLSQYAEEIKKVLSEFFPSVLPEIIIEPGRAIVAEAGVLVSEIVLISRKNYNKFSNRWIYTDVGKFNGLIETLDEAIKYPIYTEKQGVKEPVVLAGPTCDSLDVLYKNEKYLLPLDLKVGDKIYFFSTGAYTASYSSVGFNGFPPIKMIVI